MGMHQGSVSSPILLTVDVVIELAREGVLVEFLYTDDLLFMSETIDGLMNKFR